MAIAMMEPTLPIWMMETMCARKWQLGIYKALFTTDTQKTHMMYTVYVVTTAKCPQNLQSLKIHTHTHILYGEKIALLKTKSSVLSRYLYLCVRIRNQNAAISEQSERTIAVYLHS